MAQKVQILLTDDLDGREAEETVSFDLDGSSYEIDLSAKNAAKLRKVLGPYLVAGRRAGGAGRRAGQGRGRRANAGGINPTEVREWARANNVDVNDRGRVPASVIAQYREAMGKLRIARSIVLCRSLSRGMPSCLPIRGVHSGVGGELRVQAAIRVAGAGSQGSSASARVMASRAVRPWFAAESR